jgi:hypothetical protein
MPGSTTTEGRLWAVTGPLIPIFLFFLAIPHTQHVVVTLVYVVLGLAVVDLGIQSWIPNGEEEFTHNAEIGRREVAEFLLIGVLAVWVLASRIWHLGAGAGASLLLYTLALVWIDRHPKIAWKTLGGRVAKEIRGWLNTRGRWRDQRLWVIVVVIAIAISASVPASAKTELLAILPWFDIDPNPPQPESEKDPQTVATPSTTPPTTAAAPPTETTTSAPTREDLCGHDNLPALADVDGPNEDEYPFDVASLMADANRIWRQVSPLEIGCLLGFEIHRGLVILLFGWDPDILGIIVLSDRDGASFAAAPLAGSILQEIRHGDVTRVSRRIRTDQGQLHFLTTSGGACAMAIRPSGPNQIALLLPPSVTAILIDLAKRKGYLLLGIEEMVTAGGDMIRFHVSFEDGDDATVEYRPSQGVAGADHGSTDFSAHDSDPCDALDVSWYTETADSRCRSVQDDWGICDLP